MHAENLRRYYFNDDPVQEPLDVYELFQFYNINLFENVLNASHVKWSNKMTLCAGTCKHESHGSCLITLSEPLLKYRSNNEVKETLLHEMIHGYLFLTNPRACMTEGGHGPEFQQLMSIVNGITGLKVTIFHKFHDEVDNCRQHVWRCDGRCKDKPPFYGYVKRSMNRPPQKADRWFDDHQRDCGGTFIKIKEPEKKSKLKSQEKQQKDTKSKNQSKKIDKNQPKIDQQMKKPVQIGSSVPKEQSNGGMRSSAQLFVDRYESMYVNNNKQYEEQKIQEIQGINNNDNKQKQEQTFKTVIDGQKEEQIQKLIVLKITLNVHHAEFRNINIKILINPIYSIDKIIKILDTINMQKFLNLRQKIFEIII